MKNAQYTNFNSFNKSEKHVANIVGAPPSATCNAH
nr:MAG TPA: hypothetical protein [Caudoviricetes sp.]